MHERTPARGEAIFANAAVDVEDTSVLITYPLLARPRFEYDFIYTRGHQWVYLFSSDYPKFLGFQKRAEILSRLGCRWKVIEAFTGNIVWEGVEDDQEDQRSRRQIRQRQRDYADNEL